MLLDPDCERLVFGMRAHPDGAVLLASADDLEELIAAFNALTEAAQTLYS